MARKHVPADVRFLETNHRSVINKRFLGYVIERRFLWRSDPKLYIEPEEGFNTSTVALRVVVGDEKEVSDLRQ
jgi:hypothetical protein